MRKLFLWVFSLIITFSYDQEVPKVLKTEFSKESLIQSITNSEGKEVTIASVLSKHKGKVIVLEFWASWCRDCLANMTAAHKLKETNPNVDFVYFSMDRNSESWKKGIEKYELGTGDNYWFNVGWKNTFTNYVDLNWIPRYMVIDQKGKIAKYYAVSADDPDLQAIIDRLLIR